MEDSKFAHFFAVSCGYLGLSLSALLMFVGVATTTVNAATYIAPAPQSAPASQQAQPGAPVAVVLPPHCALVTDRDTYAPGDTIRIFWISANTSYAAFEPDPQSALSMPTGQFAYSGKQTISATGVGQQLLVLRVYGRGGQSATCSKSVSISS